jgi:hypothetical protein
MEGSAVAKTINTRIANTSDAQYAAEVWSSKVHVASMIEAASVRA